tara:strand:- start:3 stop:233 length:231 start_codon:yes stop_codon:yes gene_type:complete
MYKIIYSDKTESKVALKSKTLVHEGDWPSNFLQKELEAGKNLIVISTYSDTIKVPFFVEDWEAMRVDKWEFRDFPL